MTFELMVWPCHSMSRLKVEWLNLPVSTTSTSNATNFRHPEFADPNHVTTEVPAQKLWPKRGATPAPARPGSRVLTASTTKTRARRAPVSSKPSVLTFATTIIANARRNWAERDVTMAASATPIPVTTAGCVRKEPLDPFASVEASLEPTAPSTSMSACITTLARIPEPASTAMEDSTVSAHRVSQAPTALK